MSDVTNLLLHIPTAEDEDARIAEVNAFFAMRDHAAAPLVSLDNPRLPRGWYGGAKMLEVHLYAGAYNYLDIDAFFAHLRGIQWADPHNVQVLVRGQDDERFAIRYPCYDFFIHGPNELP